jgi:hypothetical protein
MFNTFKRKPDFEAIFSSQFETYKYIYGDKSKTSSTLGDKAFINAWLSSKNTGRVTEIISQEALKGDIPSLRQMIWATGFFHQGMEIGLKNDKATIAIKSEMLQWRIEFCQKAIQCGLKDQSYYAMTSSAQLYLLRSKLSVDDPITREALTGVIKYAKLFIDSGSDERELIEDAENALTHYGPLANLMQDMNA